MNFRDLLYNVTDMGSTLNTLKTIFGQKNQQGTQNLNQQDVVKAIGELSLLFETMYNLLTSKGVFTNEEFQKKFDELDMLDGVKDGRINK